MQIQFFVFNSEVYEPPKQTNIKMMAVAAAQKNREMFAIKKSYSIEVSVWLREWQMMMCEFGYDDVLVAETV